MITKNRRLAIIQELVNLHAPNSQGKLLRLLHDKGFAITQTTLSRDIKELKISKMPNDKGSYIYTNPQGEAVSFNRNIYRNKTSYVSNRGFISIEFSYQLGIIKTRAGFASSIALDINTHASSVIIGTFVHENTILIIPREDVTRNEILNILEAIIPGMKKENEE